MRKFFGILLFLFYFFVIQVLFAWYLWGQTAFYRLAFANFIFLLLLSAVYYGLNFKKKNHIGVKKLKNNSVKYNNRVNWKSIVESAVKNKINLVNIFRKYVFVSALFILILLSLIQLFRGILSFSLWLVLLAYLLLFLLFAKPLFQKKISFGKKLFLPKDFFFWTSILIVFFVYNFISFSSFVVSFEIFISVLAGFLFFVFYVLIFKSIGQYSIWKLLVSKLYLLVLILTLLFSIPQFYFQIKSSQMISSNSQWWSFAWQSFVENVWEVKNHIFGRDEIVVDEVIDLDLQDSELFTWVWTVISSSSDDVFSWDVESLVVSGNYWSGDEKLTNGVLFVPGAILFRNSDTYADDEALRYDDVLVYLIDSNDIVLSVGADIKFRYMPFSHKDYPYFKTAFHSKLIGKDLKPSSLVKCDNYLVMKGILKGWDVSDYDWDIFHKYYKAAKVLDELNSCELGKFLLKWNL